MLTPLTTVKKQWFVDWFSGDDLKAYWTKRDLGTGSGTFAMSDVVDDGFSVTSPVNSGNSSHIDFNNIRHYDFDGSVIIIVLRRDDPGNDNAHGGLIGDATKQINDATHSKSQVEIQDTASFIFLKTSDGTTQSNIDTSIAPDIVFHSAKIENLVANVKLTLDGILEVTETDNRPIAKMQPVFGSFNTSTAAGDNRIRYLEAFNT